MTTDSGFLLNVLYVPFLRKPSLSENNSVHLEKLGEQLIFCSDCRFSDNIESRFRVIDVGCGRKLIHDSDILKKGACYTFDSSPYYVFWEGHFELRGTHPIQTVAVSWAAGKAVPFWRRFLCSPPKNALSLHDSFEYFASNVEASNTCVSLIDPGRDLGSLENFDDALSKIGRKPFFPTLYGENTGQTLFWFSAAKWEEAEMDEKKEAMIDCLNGESGASWFQRFRIRQDTAGQKTH